MKNGQIGCGLIDFNMCACHKYVCISRGKLRSIIIYLKGMRLV